MSENKIKNVGIVTQVIGVVVDVKFDKKLPKLFNALKTKIGEQDLILECEQHLDDKTVRAIAMGPTDGLARAIEVEDLGEPISVPVGEKTLGRMFNVLGEPVDG